MIATSILNELFGTYLVLKKLFFLESVWETLINASDETILINDILLQVSLHEAKKEIYHVW